MPSRYSIFEVMAHNSASRIAPLNYRRRAPRAPIAAGAATTGWRRARPRAALACRQECDLDHSRNPCGPVALCWRRRVDAHLYARRGCPRRAGLSLCPRRGCRWPRQRRRCRLRRRQWCRRVRPIHPRPCHLHRPRPRRRKLCWRVRPIRRRPRHLHHLRRRQWFRPRLSHRVRRSRLNLRRPRHPRRCCR